MKCHEIDKSKVGKLSDMLEGMKAVRDLRAALLDMPPAKSKLLGLLAKGTDDGGLFPDIGPALK